MVLDRSWKRARGRSIYFTVKRSNLVPILQVFDWPDDLQGMGERQTTTIAPQALMLMNDPQVARGRRAWQAGSRGPKGGDNSAAVVQAACCLVLGREPNC